MEMNHMEMKRIVGVVVLAIGLVLLGFAYHSTNAPMEKISDAMIGRYSNQTMWYFAVGVAAAVGGGLLALFGGRK
jgi:succinate dehydrogenase hydrophobic anchor subunit